MENYAKQLSFLASYGVEGVELTDSTGQRRVFLVPAWQGRVMTSTAAGPDGDGFGWINRSLVASQSCRRQFNPWGGEERFWLGPEGGPFSFYFAPGASQVYENWQVPAALDTEPFTVGERRSDRVCFSGRMPLVNAAGTRFEIGVKRSVELLKREEAVSALCALEDSDELHVVAYRSQNTIINCGSEAWTPACGAPSVWMLGMFPPAPRTVVLLPYAAGDGPAVNSGYFGSLAEDRLTEKGGIAFFRCDGTLRSKIGLPAGRDCGICGSYDADNNTLTVIRHTPSRPESRYVDSQWGVSTPFGGDVVNAYNDGPTQNGEVMGPFYEIETSSPAAFLQAGQSLCHTQEIIHLQGPELQIDGLVSSLFGIRLSDLDHIFGL